MENNNNNNNVRHHRKNFTKLKNIDGNNNNNRLIQSTSNNSNNNNLNNSNNNNNSKDFIKVVIIGESGSGKSNIIKRFIYNEFDERSPSTIGIDFSLYEFQSNSIKNLNNNNNNNKQQIYQAQIWDTAGMERYRSSITNIFYRNVNGALLVFDITRRDHFNELPKWIDEIRKNIYIHNNNNNNNNQNDIDKIPIILIGNKCDLNKSREINYNEAIQFTKLNNLLTYIETSAKFAINIQIAFDKLFNYIIELKKNDYHQQQKIDKNVKKFKNLNKIQNNNNNNINNINNNNSIKLQRDQYYLEQRARNKKKSKCNC